MTRAGRRRSYHRLSFAAKREYARRLRPQHVLYQCRICKVKTNDVDRQQHLDRQHGGGDVLVCFHAVTTGSQ
jgi:hypothetical protein